MKIVIAREVEHKDHGCGTVVIGTHGDLTENGEIPSYDVQWTDSSITQNVPADELSVLDGDEVEIDGVEYLDELSRKTLGNYIRKASHDSLQHFNKASQGREAWHHGVNDGERRMGLKQMKAGHHIVRNRHLGIDQAARKLSKEQGVSKQRLWLSKEQFEYLVAEQSGELKESVHKILDTHSRDNGDKWELHGHAVGQAHEWHAITKTHTAGVSNKNEWGGYNATKLGSPKYIRSHWKNIKSSTVGHTPTNISGLAKMKEDVESIDELSKKTLSSYVKNAVRDVHNQHAVPYGSFNARKVHNRNNNIVYATDRLEGRNKKISKEEVEPIDELEIDGVEYLDELSRKTLGSYIKKAKDNYGEREYDRGHASGNPTYFGSKESSKQFKLSKNRSSGIRKAVDKLTREEFEELKSIEEKHWIAKATENKGGLHRTLGIPEGEKIPQSKINAAAKKGGKEGKEANLAKTLEKMHEEPEDDVKKAKRLALRASFKAASRVGMKKLGISNWTKPDWEEGPGRGKWSPKHFKEESEEALEEGRGRPKGTFKKPPEGSENPSHPDHKKYKAYQAKVSGHTASNAAKKKAGEKVEDHGDPETSGDRHIISQLQKASVTSSREPHHISFDNGKTHPVSKELAKKALGRYSTVAKGHGVASGETGRADHAKHMQKSLEHLHGYAAGHPVTKERKISRDELLAPKRYQPMKEDKDIVVQAAGTESPGHEGAGEVHSIKDQIDSAKHNPIVQGGHGLPGDKYKSMSAFASKNRLPDDLEATIMNILKQKNDIIVKRSYEEFLKGKHNGG